MTDQDLVDRVVRSARTIAVVGCSDRPDGDSHRVAAYLQRAGFRVIPVNPGLTAVLGERVGPDLASVPSEPAVAAVAAGRRRASCIMCRWCGSTPGRATVARPPCSAAAGC